MLESIGQGSGSQIKETIVNEEVSLKLAPILQGQKASGVSGRALQHLISGLKELKKTTQKPRTSLQLAKSIARFADDKKAERITVLDMRKVANFCDYFVLCNGSSNRQIRAIADGIDDGFEKFGLKIQYKQGLKEGHWVVLDLGSVVAHIFDSETREFYGLEYLWQDAKRVNWKK